MLQDSWKAHGTRCKTSKYFSRKMWTYRKLLGNSYVSQDSHTFRMFYLLNSFFNSENALDLQQWFLLILTMNFYFSFLIILIPSGESSTEFFRMVLQNQSTKILAICLQNFTREILYNFDMNSKKHFLWLILLFFKL